MTIEQAIYAVFEGTGKTSDDYPVRKRFVYNELKNAYRELVRQDLNKYRNWESAQTLSCVEMERVDAASCLDCDSGIYILRSKKALPDILETDFGPAITGAYLQNGVKIDAIDRAHWLKNKRRRYALNNPGFFHVNNFINLVNYDDVDELIIDVEAFFNDPEEITIRNREATGCTDGTECTPIYMGPFECPGHLTRRVIEICREAVFRKLGIPIDTNNNAKSDINVQSKP